MKHCVYYNLEIKMMLIVSIELDREYSWEELNGRLW